MKTPLISVSATNPCHLYNLAQELAAQGALKYYYSGYPRWRLKPPLGFPLKQSSGRTLITYGLNRLPWFARRMHRIFRWQDEGFDRAVARMLEACDWIHAMPGQAQKTFERAKELGIKTVLNHATGPVRLQMEKVREEYKRAGLKNAAEVRFDAGYFALEEEEYRLADYHCVASRIVREQLVQMKVDPARVWVVPYSADNSIYYPATGKSTDPAVFQVVFAGQQVLRKGVRTLLEALRMAGESNWRLDCYGQSNPESEPDFGSYSGVAPVIRHGAVAAPELAEAFRRADLLVLPSLEEGFGLVVPQALACGCPCVVSDSVGAQDLIRHRENGSIFPVQNAARLSEELLWWSRNRQRVCLEWSWKDAADLMLEYSR